VPALHAARKYDNQLRCALGALTLKCTGDDDSDISIDYSISIARGRGAEIVHQFHRLTSLIITARINNLPTPFITPPHIMKNLFHE
jgi:hypothetical protein